MQEKIKMNGIEIFQPEKDLGYDWQITYSEDSGRVYSGRASLSPLFTVEQLSYKASGIPIQEVSKILKIIMSGNPFTLHYFSPYYGMWRDGEFYVGQGQATLGTLKEKQEIYSSFSFNMTGVDPVQ